VRKRKRAKSSPMFSTWLSIYLENGNEQGRCPETDRSSASPLVVVTRRRCHNFILTVRRRRGFQLISGGETRSTVLGGFYGDAR
jgi:hypothetical protein